jgi:hypothetical protein
MTGMGAWPWSALRFPCNADKEPLTQHGFEDAKRYHYNMRWPLVGLPTGIDFIVFDFDPGGLAYAGLLPEDTFTQQTRRGLHKFYLPEPGWPSMAWGPRREVELKAARAYVIDWSREGLPYDNWPLRRVGMTLEEVKAAFREKLGGKPDAEGSLLNRLRAPSQLKDYSPGTNPFNVDLFQIDPTKYRDLNSWLALMTACKVAAIDRDAFVEWSISDPKYADAEQSVRKIWDRLKPDGRISERTLFRALRRVEEEPVDRGSGSSGMPKPPLSRRQMTWRDQARMKAIADVVVDEGKLFWAACRYGEMRMVLRIEDNALEDLLMSAAWRAGLRNKPRSRRQIRNGLRIGAAGWGSTAGTVQPEASTER